MTDDASLPTTSSTAGTAQRSTLFSGLRVVSLCTLVSRILGLLRDMQMARLFGAGPILDAFTVAFQIPNLARQLLGEGALTAAFLPAFVREKEQSGQEAAQRLTFATFVRLGQLLIGLVAITEIGIGLLILLHSWGPDGTRLLQLTAIFAPYVVLVCLTALLGAALQSLNRFFWPAVLPVLLNLFWLGAVALSDWGIVDAEWQVRAIAIGLVVAGFFQLLVPLGVLLRTGFGWSRDWRESLPLVRGIFQSMLPVVVGVTLSQLNALVDRVLAWGLSLPGVAASNSAAWLPVLESGTVSALYLGQRMYQFPLGVFGVALGTVLFPILSRHAEQGDMPGFRSDLSLGLRLAVAIGLPASCGLMLVAGPLSTALFQAGRFDAADAALTTSMVRAYGSAAWAFILLLIANRGFYALGDRQTPVRIGKYSVAWNLGISLLLIYPLRGAGLAWGTSLATMLQAIWSMRVLSRQCGGIEPVAARAVLLRTVIACGVMAGVVLGVQSLLAGWSMKIQLATQCLAGGVAFLGTARLLGLREPEMLWPARSPARH